MCIELAVNNGAVEQLSQAFAFDVRDADELERQLQSWNFVVSRVRQDGAAMGADPKARRAIPSDVPIAIAFQEPRSPSARINDVFEAAQDAWSSLAVQAVPASQLDTIAREVRDLQSV